MIQSIRNLVNRIFKIDIIRFPNSDLRRRIKLLESHNINLVLDVGSNVGQYAKQIRAIGYKGKIHSFEPQTKIFKFLSENSKQDPLWECYNFALGDKNEKGKINISQNSYSSSILEITKDHLDSEAKSQFVNFEEVEILKLDDFLPQISNGSDRILLKLDVQGFENRVLEGAIESLDRIVGIQVELSLVSMYSGEMLFIEMIEKLKSLGFYLTSLENGFYNKNSGQLLQVDGIFFRK